jgi:hypothetical protein
MWEKDVLNKYGGGSESTIIYVFSDVGAGWMEIG